MMMKKWMILALNLGFSSLVCQAAETRNAFVPGEIWPDNAIDGCYIWLPIQFDPSGKPFIAWKDRWDLGFFDSTGNNS